MSSAAQSKILNRDALRVRAQEWRQAGELIILANGCFDVLHVGHIRYLQAAKALGGKLIVAVKAAESVRKVQGGGGAGRAASGGGGILAGLGAGGAGVVFSLLYVPAVLNAVPSD